MRLFHFWLAVGSLAALAAFCTATSNCTLTSTLKPPVERVFSRKKRWLIFPKGSALKFTVSVSKRLLAIYPRGMNFVLEAATYYPMPGARIDLIPKRFRKPTTKAPKPKGTTPLSLIGIPGSLIKYRARPATRAPVVQRVDYNISDLQWISPSRTPPKWSKYESPEYYQKYQWSPEKQQKYVGKYENVKYHDKKWNKWDDHNNEQPHWHRYNRDLENFENVYEPDYVADLVDYEQSPHYHSYRGRRDLFDHFEGLSKSLHIDVKTCILRTICDSKRFLLPTGYSMIQDILRVLFTFPTINGLKDDYTRIGETDYETCDAMLHHKCPFSILDWLLNSKKSL